MSRFPVETRTNKDAREALIRGMNVVADAVSATLGPKSRNVAINQAAGAPKIIHDGVSVAKSIDLADPFEDMGAQLLKEVAIKTNEVAGDGTTTSTILAQELVNLGNELIVSGANPMTLKVELEEACKFVITELQKLARPVKDTEEIEKVASISSASPEIGKIVAEAIEKVGKHGIIDVELGKGSETEIEYKQGMEIDRGYKSPYFVTNQDTVEAEIENPYILLTDKKINNALDIGTFLNNFLKADVGRNLVIIGEVEEEALATLVLNNLKKVINVVAIQPPAFGARQVDELEDLAILTGGTVIKSESGRSLETVTIEELGRADKVRSDRDKTVILGGQGNKALLEQKITELQKQVDKANTGYDAAIKKQRLAKLVGGVAVIKVGGITEVELFDKKERVIDAISAAKASVEEGIVAGGQISFLAVAQLPDWPKTPGAELLKRALKKPFKVLMSNTGLDYAEVLGQITPIEYPRGMDVNDGEVKDLIENGVIDPLKVSRSALENAVSIAGMAFTTSVLISEPYKAIETK